MKKVRRYSTPNKINAFCYNFFFLTTILLIEFLRFLAIFMHAGDDVYWQCKGKPAKTLLNELMWPHRIAALPYRSAAVVRFSFRFSFSRSFVLFASNIYLAQFQRNVNMRNVQNGTKTSYDSSCPANAKRINEAFSLRQCIFSCAISFISIRFFLFRFFLPFFSSLRQFIRIRQHIRFSGSIM